MSCKGYRHGARLRVTGLHPAVGTRHLAGMVQKVRTARGGDHVRRGSQPGACPGRPKRRRRLTSARVDRTMATIALRPAEYNALRVRAAIATRPDPRSRPGAPPRHGNPAGLSGDSGSRQSGSGHRHQHWRFATGFRYSGTAGGRPRRSAREAERNRVRQRAYPARRRAGAVAQGASLLRRRIRDEVSFPLPEIEALDVRLERLPARGQQMPSITNSSFEMSPSQASQVSPRPGPPQTRGMLLNGRRPSMSFWRTMRRRLCSCTVTLWRGGARTTPDSPGSRRRSASTQKAGCRHRER